MASCRRYVRLRAAFQPPGAPARDLGNIALLLGLFDNLGCPFDSASVQDNDDRRHAAPHAPDFKAILCAFPEFVDGGGDYGIQAGNDLGSLSVFSTPPLRFHRDDSGDQPYVRQLEGDSEIACESSARRVAPHLRANCRTTSMAIIGFCRASKMVLHHRLLRVCALLTYPVIFCPRRQ